MSVKRFAAGLMMSAFLVAPAAASMITPDIIWGSGNTNRGFEVNTFGSLELGIRAKQRLPTPNDQIGVGIVRDSNGTYLFDINDVNLPSNRSIWNFDWSINSDIEDGSDALNTYTYLISVDYDPSSAFDMRSYDPFSVDGTGFYLGTNSSGNGGTTFLTGDLSQANVAQNSVNMGFLTDAPLRAGDFRVSLSAFSGNDLIGSTTIDIKVVSAPATALILASAFGGLVMMRRQKRKSV